MTVLPVAHDPHHLLALCGLAAELNVIWANSHGQSEEQVPCVSRIGDALLVIPVHGDHSDPDRIPGSMGERNQLPSSALSSPPQSLWTKFCVGILHAFEPMPRRRSTREESFAFQRHGATQRFLAAARLVGNSFSLPQLRALAEANLDKMHAHVEMAA